MDESHVKRFNGLNSIDEDKITSTVAITRGRDFEELLLDILNSEEILHKGSYHTKDNRSEQIDAAIEVYNRMFLVEIKWVKSGIAASDLFAFTGKVENKFYGTLGVFISRISLSNNVINALNKGRRQTVIVIHGSDLDLIFEHKIRFEDYIKDAFKILSYDNVLHFPVMDFIKMQAAKREKKQIETDQRTEHVKFAKQFLLSKPISRVELITEMENLTASDRVRLFDFVLRKYSTIWYGSREDNKYYAIDNAEVVLENKDVGLHGEKRFAELYYGELIEKDLPVYAKPVFSHIFAAYYPQISQQAKNMFEAHIIAKMDEWYGIYDAENDITAIVEPVWSDLSENAKSSLANKYLEIYLSSRLNKYPQKQFSIRMLQEKLVSPEIIKGWLLKKLTEDKEAYKSIDENTITSLAYTYRDFAAYLGVTNDDWYAYVKSIIEP